MTERAKQPSQMTADELRVRIERTSVRGTWGGDCSELMSYVNELYRRVPSHHDGLKPHEVGNHPVRHVSIGVVSILREVERLHRMLVSLQDGVGAISFESLSPSVNVVAAPHQEGDA